MIAIVPILIAALSIGTSGTQLPAGNRPPQTDQTVAVSRGARLTIDNRAGDVVVRSWDKDSLRVQARHASRARVHIQEVGTGVRLSSSAERGPAGSIDYEITAPAWMPVRVNGQFNFVVIEGMRAEVSVDTVRGDVMVKGGNGVTVKSTEGDISLEGAAGKINVSSINQGIAITGGSGEIIAETVNGPITMTRVDAASVEASTINGNIGYDGSATKGGHYRFTSHNGSITVAVPETSNAAFFVRTYSGGFNTSLPVKKMSEGDIRQGRRVMYTLGNGSAEFELESFSGGIRLRPPGTISAAKPRNH